MTTLNVPRANGHTPELWEGTEETAEWLEAAPSGVKDTQALIDEMAQRKLRQLLADEAARRQYAAIRAGSVEIPASTSLADLLDEPDEETPWRIADLWPKGGNVLLAAAYKAGKTTTVGNLVRSLVDGDPFLGRYPVEQVTDGTVGVIDLEMPRVKFKDWLRNQGIKNKHLVRTWTLRGQSALVNFVDEGVREKWAAQFRAVNLRVLIIDCLAPILSALGVEENANSDVGPVLDSIVTMATEAGIDEVLLVHHMGHVAERSRGASRLRDWPDAEWRLVRQRGDDGAEADPDAPRFFSAFGRDVDVREGQLAYDKATKRLTYVDRNRRDAKARQHVDQVLLLIAKSPNLSKNTLERQLCAAGVERNEAREAIRYAVTDGQVCIHDGPRNAQLHRIKSRCPDCSPTAPAGNIDEDQDAFLPYNSETGQIDDCADRAALRRAQSTDCATAYRTVAQSVPTRTPPAPAQWRGQRPLSVCTVCHGPLDDADGTGRHVNCEPDGISVRPINLFPRDAA